MTQTMHHSDHQLKAFITDELAWAPEVEADRVGVALSDGAVTLSGEVKSYPEKRAAVAAALRVKGVTAVADEIVVESTWGPRADADIAREAAVALQGAVVLPNDTVKAEVHEHRISLSGAVPWNYQRDAAERAVTGLAGVTSVDNGIRIKPTMTFAAEKAKSSITAAFARSAQLDANRIKVSLEGTEIGLTGSVSSWSEFRQAAYAAWATPGVTLVHNDLRVSA